MELTRIIGSHQILIPGSVQNELKILANKGNGKRAQNAQAALKLIQKFQIITDQDRPVDDNILLLALELHAYVVTNDKELRHRLREKHIAVIFLRGKQKLEIDT